MSSSINKPALLWAGLPLLYVYLTSTPTSRTLLAMFSTHQRQCIIIGSCGLLLGASITMNIVHDILLVAVPYYLSIGIIAYLSYIGWQQSIRIWHA